MKLLIDWIEQLARWFALAGGLILLVLVVMTIISVTGRTINAYGFGPILGDFELVEHGTAFVVFCALPYCQLRYGHVAVDVLARKFPYILGWIVALASQLAFLATAFLISRQLYLGLLDKLNWGETSFILQLPVWWGYAASLPATGLWVITALITVLQTALALKTRRELP
ncbi:MAG: TRAP transporter small permease [Candidatus Puniceispirillaceae bacterium]